MEINQTDSLKTPLVQLDTQRTSINPFAPADDAAVKNTEKTEGKAKTNNISSATDLIKTFKLTNPENKFKLLTLLNYSQQQAAISLLSPEAKVLGMKLYNKDKILNLLFDTSQKDISKVLMGAMPMEEIFKKIPEEFLNRFIMSDKLEKKDFLKAFEQYSPEQLIKFMENLTGLPQTNVSKPEMLKALEKVPFQILQPSLLTIKPEQKVLMISKMMQTNKDLFEVFSKGQLLMPLDQIGKEETIKGFAELETNLVSEMLKQLPDEVMPLLLSMIDSEVLANMLINSCPEVIEAAFNRQSEFLGE